MVRLKRCGTVRAAPGHTSPAFSAIGWNGTQAPADRDPYFGMSPRPRGHCGRLEIRENFYHAVEPVGTGYALLLGIPTMAGQVLRPARLSPGPHRCRPLFSPERSRERARTAGRLRRRRSNSLGRPSAPGSRDPGAESRDVGTAPSSRLARAATAPASLDHHFRC